MSLIKMEKKDSKQFCYKNIILYTSHQWCGNTEKYFAKHTEKFFAVLLMPRVQNKDNLLRIYHFGKIVDEIPFQLSENIFLFYLRWYIHYIWMLYKYFTKGEKIYVINFHPYMFFGGSIQKLFRNVEFVFWIADYFPPINKVLVWFEKMKKYYHDRIRHACYLGDGVNKKMNGKVMKTQLRQTIMWGVDPKKMSRELSKIKYTLLYVGVVRPNVGLDIVFQFLHVHKEYKLKVIGICDAITFRHYMKMIKELGISNQVYFPNRFFFENELNKLSKECLLGLALYNTSSTSTIYYADPGKTKAYAEMQLPVVMSKTSSVMPYIMRFHAGEVIDRTPEALYEAVKKITRNYDSYLKGLNKFNSFFYYDTYYKKRFRFLEDKR